MINEIAKWIWSVPSIDEYWNEQLKDKTKQEASSIISELPDDLLKEYLTLKMRYGIGKPIFLSKQKGHRTFDCWDIRNYETYLKVNKLYNE